MGGSFFELAAIGCLDDMNDIRHSQQGMRRPPAKLDALRRRRGNKRTWTVGVPLTPAACAISGSCSMSISTKWICGQEHGTRRREYDEQGVREKQA